MSPPADVDAAVSALQAGRLVILPTETVYGLAADAADPAAIARLYEAKGRPRFNPLIAHVTDAAMAGGIAALDGLAERLMEAFWPGPLTLVLPVRDGGGVCDLARAGLDTVAVRAPAHPMAQAVIGGLGRPVCAPSANRSGRPSPTTWSDAVEETGDAAAAALDGGPCAIGVESTVVAVIGGQVQLLRPGGLDRAAIEALVGPLSHAAEGERRSPGRLALHYAPNAPVRLNADGATPDEVLLAFGPAPDGAPGGPRVFNLSRRGDVREAAANLFAMLRAADRLGPRAIAVAPIPMHGLGEAINDRLKRAAGYVG